MDQPLKLRGRVGWRVLKTVGLKLQKNDIKKLQKFSLLILILRFKLFFCPYKIRYRKTNQYKTKLFMRLKSSEVMCVNDQEIKDGESLNQLVI